MSSYRTTTAARQSLRGHSFLCFLQTIRAGLLPREMWILLPFAYLALC